MNGKEAGKMQSNAERQPGIRHINLDEKRPYSADTSISSLMDKWLEYKKGFVKESTHSNWLLTAENHIKPFFREIRLGELTEGDLQDFIVFLHHNGRLDGNGGFSLKSIRDIMLPLRMALEHAYKYNRSLQRFDFDLLEYPKDRNKDKVKAMTYEQQRRFIQSIYLNLNSHTAAYLIVIVTGLRIGEICGLQMQDISLIQQTISVNKTIYRTYDVRTHSTKLVIDTPKTSSSVRTIPFPEMLVRVIERFYDAKHPEYYFISGGKKPTEPRTLRQCFDRFLQKNNLPHMKFHELRHTFAARAMEDPDFDVKTLSAILGHKNPAFTLNVYGRTSMERETECMKSMNKWL